MGKTSIGNRGLFSDVASSLVKIGTQGSEGYNKAVQNLADFDVALAKKYGDIEQIFELNKSV